MSKPFEPPAHLPPRPERADKAATAEFYREWLRRPLSVAAVSPSGRRLAAAVAAAVGTAQSVVELGGGTGALTEALVAREIPNLVIIESNPAFCAVLRGRFPGIDVIQGDAAHAPKLLVGSRVAPGHAEVVVSGLGMLHRPRLEQQLLLEAMVRLLTPDGYIVQFSYSPFFPATRGLLSEMGLESRREAVTWRNLPPAAVFTVRRDPSHEAVA